MPPKKDVVKKDDTNLLPVALEELEGLSGSGFENADSDSYAIPFLRILQSTSPQVDEEGPAYVDGAKVGMLLNTVTNELFGKEVKVIPIHYSRDFVEWKPDRGGFVKSHGNDPSILQKISHIDDKNNSFLENGNVIQDTRNHYLLIADRLELGPIILSLVSTGIKHSKKWMSLMAALRLPNSDKQAPMFAGVWDLQSIRNSNDDGTWYQIGDKNMTGVEFSGWVNKEQLDAAMQARELITSGSATADYDSTIDKNEGLTQQSNGGGWDGNQGYPETGGPGPGGGDVPF